MRGSGGGVTDQVSQGWNSPRGLRVENPTETGPPDNEYRCTREEDSNMVHRGLSGTITITVVSGAVGKVRL